MLARRSGTLGSALVKEIATLLGFRWDDDGLAMQPGLAAPFVAPDLISAICATRPDSEVLALGLAARQRCPN
ncbi:hypothetical protein J2Z75_005159 [Rhizobium herbae]|uniref:Uncharacterized protein n=2 Tax=Rhizobium herbae TaxID=508661 RepID=A0ABS4EUJ4_9HYPH|nr:hypothetical protein [Rhizobium herbae]